MKKQKKSILVLAVMAAFIGAGLFLPGLISADNPNPSAAPGPPIKTLDGIPPTWSKILLAAERFELVMGDAAVLDKETGLVWARNASIGINKTWQEAMSYCQNLKIGNRKGWRLPTVEELASLVDCNEEWPALPAGYDLFFIQVVWDYYWSSTTCEGESISAWGVGMPLCHVGCYDTLDFEMHVWPVRGGN